MREALKKMRRGFKQNVQGTCVKTAVVAVASWLENQLGHLWLRPLEECSSPNVARVPLLAPGPWHHTRGSASADAIYGSLRAGQHGAVSLVRENPGRVLRHDFFVCTSACGAGVGAGEGATNVPTQHG